MKNLLFTLIGLGLCGAAWAGPHVTEGPLTVAPNIDRICGFLNATEVENAYDLTTNEMQPGTYRVYAINETAHAQLEQLAQQASSTCVSGVVGVAEGRSAVLAHAASLYLYPGAPISCQRGFHPVKLDDGTWRCVPNYRF